MDAHIGMARRASARRRRDPATYILLWALRLNVVELKNTALGRLPLIINLDINAVQLFVSKIEPIPLLGGVSPSGPLDTILSLIVGDAA